MEHIDAFVREFARSAWGQQVLMEIEDFGLPGVESAADLTHIQSAFLNIARQERQHKANNRGPNI